MNEKEKPYFYGDMNSADVMDKTFDFYRVKLPAHLGATFFVYLLSLTAFGIALFGGLNIIVPAITELSDNHMLSSISGVLGVAGILLLIAVFFSFASKTVNVVIFNDTLSGRRTSVKGILIDFFILLPRIIAVTLTNLVILAPLSFILLVIFFMSVKMTSFVNNAVLLVLEMKLTPRMTAYITALLAIYAVVYAASLLLSFSVPAAIMEKKYFFEAVARSFSLFTDRRGLAKNVGLLILYGVIHFILFALSFAVLSILISTPEISYNQMVYNVIFIAIRVLASIAISSTWTPIRSILTGVLYVRSRSTSEGFDMELAVKNLSRKNAEGYNEEYTEEYTEEYEEEEIGDEC